MPQPDARLVQFLQVHGLCPDGQPARWTPLAGGVSSDIWRVDLARQTICVKCALPKLKVAREWLAPISRNAYEWAWINFAAANVPGSVPRPLAHDPVLGAFAMEFLDGESHPVWKNQLLAGIVDLATARQVATALGKLHAASVRDASLPAQFQTDDIFYPIRLEPYLVATAEVHPDLASKLRELADQTLNTHIALIHGDVSPKNILVGPRGPVFLDAECAWFGDPAFDIAFCLNHFLLKCVVQRRCIDALLACFATFVDAYLAEVDWEDPRHIEQRAARLLPALFLARVDGKSPVEYITEDYDKQQVRQAARPLVAAPPQRLCDIATAWRKALACYPNA
jgi:aminoglycoside phosphotransferase (APT) family kinase protein